MTSTTLPRASFLPPAPPWWPRVAAVLARPLVLALLLWLLMLPLRLQDGWAFIQSGLNHDPDSIMRMIQVRDLLHGQTWFDLHQYRIGPEGGVVMHWSRIGDLLPMGLVWLATPFAGAARAELIAQALSPLILLLPALWLTIGIAVHLQGRKALLPAAIVILMSQSMMTVFKPGDIDHHNLQLLCVLLLVWAGTAARTLRHGVIGGSAIALSMTIGIETAPHILAVLASLGVLWMAAPAQEQKFMRGLGIGLLLAGTLCLWLFMPRPWSGAFCDSWTPPLFWFTAGLGLLATAAGALPASWHHTGLVPALRRGGVLVTGAVLVAGLVILAYPVCLQHPGGTDPILWRYWMDNITENEGVIAMMRTRSFAEGFIYLASVPACVVAAAWLVLKNPAAHSRWLVPLAATVAGLAVTLLHVRGHMILSAAVIGLSAALIAHWRSYPDSRRILGWILFSSYPYIIGCYYLNQTAFDKPTSDTRQAYCHQPETLAALNQLPPSLLMVPLHAEPMLLVQTRHRSLGATYHRNVTGNLALLNAFIAPPDTAHRIAKRMGADYVLYCPGYAVSNQMAKELPHSLARALTDRHPPAWLQPVQRLPHDVTLYRVTD